MRTHKDSQNLTPLAVDSFRAFLLSLAKVQGRRLYLLESGPVRANPSPQQYPVKSLLQYVELRFPLMVRGWDDTIQTSN